MKVNSVVIAGIVTRFHSKTNSKQDIGYWIFRLIWVNYFYSSQPDLHQ
jgi:hypothetical protein